MVPFLFEALVIQVGIPAPHRLHFSDLSYELRVYRFYRASFSGQSCEPFGKTPGRSAVDAAASFMGGNAIGLMLTNEMYKNQRYNTREASVIATGFPVVCVSFFIVVAKTASIMHLWTQFFLTSLLVTYGVTAITARLYPLAGKSAGYYREGEGVLKKTGRTAH